jgi:hypothetical protein
VPLGPVTKPTCHIFSADDSDTGQIVRTVNLRVMTLAVTAGLTSLLLAACTSDAVPTAGTEDGRDHRSTTGLNDIADVEPGEFNSEESYFAFCTAISAKAPDPTNGSLTFEDVLVTYRAALDIAPAEIAYELAALLDFLEFGIEPDFGEPPEVSVVPPLEPDTEVTSESDPARPETDDADDAGSDPASEPSESLPMFEPTDPFVFVAPDAEQLALSVAEFLESYCRGVAVNPLPPPTTPPGLPSEESQALP